MVILPKYFDDIYSKNCRETYQKYKAGCDLCQGSGIKILGCDQFVDCSCTKKYLKIRPYLQMGISPKHINLTLADLKENYDEDTFNRFETVYNEILSLTNYDLFFVPGNLKGWGTTSAASILLKKLIDNGKVGSVISSKALMKFFFIFDDDEIKEVREYLLNVDAVLIDDFGGEMEKKLKECDSFISSRFRSFLDERSRNGKQTIMASNVTVGLLKEKYSTELYTLIKEHFLTFPITSKSVRMSAIEELKIERKSSNKVINAFKDMDEIGIIRPQIRSE